MAANGPLAYTMIRPLDRAHGGRQLARIICNCGAHDEITAPSPNNPEFVAKKFREKGWETDGFKQNNNRCPECAKKKKPTTTLAAMEAAMPKPKELPVNANSPQPVREATPDERMRVRTYLDKHFDDSRGCYLDGYSDQKIGQELGIPWAIVAKIREAGWGPIRTDPELEGVKNELAAALKTVDEKMRDVATVRSDIIKLEQRIAAIGRRFATS